MGIEIMLDAIAGADVPGAILYLRVDDIQQAYRDLQARGIAFVDEPHMINRDDAGLTNIDFHDPTTDPLPSDASVDLVTTSDDGKPC